MNYWASARAEAGVAADVVPTAEPLTLAEVRRRAEALHPDTRLAAVLSVCAVLVGQDPVSSADPDDVLVAPGETVEFLPPFAGGAR